MNRGFQDLMAWQKAIDLGVKIYKLQFEDRDFKSQIRRASVSVSNNIAEGTGRHSKKDFIRFLRIARSSCFEVHSMILLAKRLETLEVSVTEKLEEDLKFVSVLIIRLIQSLEKTL